MSLTHMHARQYLIFDPIESSDIIVGGRITGWEETQTSESVYPRPTDDIEVSKGDEPPFITVRVTMAVETFFKGNGPPSLSIVDSGSLLKDIHEWAGGSGFCGSFDDDPAGRYAIIGLTRNDDGEWQANRLRMFFLGEQPQGAAYESALTRLVALGVEELPMTGVGPASTLSQPLNSSVLMSSIGLGIALSALGLAAFTFGRRQQ